MSDHDLRPRRRVSDASGILDRSRYPLASVAIAVVAVVLITIVGFTLGTVDLGLSKALNGLHTGALGAFTTAVYHVISPGPAIGITVVVVAVIWWRTRDLRPALAFGGTIAITWVPSAVVKEIVHRARPDVAVLPHPFPVQPDPGYPSGHTVYITAFVIALVWLLRDTGGTASCWASGPWRSSSCSSRCRSTPCTTRRTRRRRSSGRSPSLRACGWCGSTG